MPVVFLLPCRLHRSLPLLPSPNPWRGGGSGLLLLLRANVCSTEIQSRESNMKGLDKARSPSCGRLGAVVEETHTHTHTHAYTPQEMRDEGGTGERRQRSAALEAESADREAHLKPPWLARRKVRYGKHTPSMRAHQSPRPRKRRREMATPLKNLLPQCPTMMPICVFIARPLRARPFPFRLHLRLWWTCFASLRAVHFFHTLSLRVVSLAGAPTQPACRLKRERERGEEASTTHCCRRIDRLRDEVLAVTLDHHY